MSSPHDGVWLLCSACRTGIGFGAVHLVCSVSTCNRSRTRLVFCSVACWDSHLSTVRHRESWAVEEIAPTREVHAREQEEQKQEQDRPALAPPRASPRPAALAFESPRVAPPASPSPRAAASPSSASPGSVTAHAGGPALSSSFDHDDVLIVVSKVKKYIRDRSGMNTSDAIATAIGDHVRSICDEAVRAAARDGRKTVLDRDVPVPPNRR
jgi:hypothetical protein